MYFTINTRSHCAHYCTISFSLPNILLVFCCYHKNCHKLSALKQDVYPQPSPAGHEPNMGLSGLRLRCEQPALPGAPCGEWFSCTSRCYSCRTKAPCPCCQLRSAPRFQRLPTGMCWLWPLPASSEPAGQGGGSLSLCRPLLSHVHIYLQLALPSSSALKAPAMRGACLCHQEVLTTPGSAG